MATTPRPLTPKQQRFVEEYLVDLNATQAAVRAGYSKRTAYSQGHDLLKKPEIGTAIAAWRERVAERAEMTAADWFREVSLLAKSDIGEIMDFSGEEPRLKEARTIPVHARRAISGIKVKRYVEGHGEDARTVEVTEFKLWSKDSALDKAGKYLGLQTERHEHTGKDGAPLIPLAAVDAILRDDT